MAFRTSLFSASLGCALAAVSISSKANPSNDDFANSIPLAESSDSFSGNLFGATLEAGEPSLPAFVSGGSIWWSWTAGATGPVFISCEPPGVTNGASAAMEVFSGSTLSSLTELTGNYLDWPAGRFAAFNALAGTTYHIRVAGTRAEDLTFRLRPSAMPVILTPPQSAVISPFGSTALYVAAGSASAPGYQWLYNGTPLSGQTAAIMLLYRFNTNNVGDYSVTVSNASGAVTSSPAHLAITDVVTVPSLTAAINPTPANFQFHFNGEAGRWYRLETSSNLNHWAVSRYFLCTGAEVASVTFNPSQGRGFVRGAVNLEGDDCGAQLQALGYAERIALIQLRKPAIYAPAFFEIVPFMPGQSFVYCPDGGTYILGNAYDGAHCSLAVSRGHSAH